MRKFKNFIASVLAYLMLISLVPNNLVESIANASENQQSTVVKNGYYLRSNAQYNNKVLVAYEEFNGKSNEFYISLVEDGEEVVLKTVSDVYYVKTISNNTSKVALKYYVNYKEPYYEEFDFESLQFKSISKDDYDNLENSIIEYPYGWNQTLLTATTEDRDNIIEKALQNINDKNSEYNFTISDKEFQDDIDGLTYINENGNYINIKGYQIGANNEETNVNIDLLSLFIKKYENNETKTYNAIISDENVYLEEINSDNSWDGYFNINYYGGKSLFLTKSSDNESKRIIEIENNEFVTNQIVDFAKEFFVKIDNKIYVPDHSNKTLKIYSKEGNEYKFLNQIECLSYSLDWIKNYNLPSIIEKENGRIYFSQIVNDNIVKRIDITDEINTFKEISVGIQGDKKGNYFIYNFNDFMIIQNNSNKKPSNPQEPVKPDDSQQHTSLDIEVPTLNANEVNEIPVLSSNTKNFNVIVKDIEALKNGQGSLKLALNKVNLSLPFSVVDKDLLDENDTVSVKLDVLADSEITKDLKAVNKVFDFNLVINKENEAIKIHNFKDGVAEITFALTDEELKGLNRDNLVVYYYNENTKEFEAMETKVEGTNVTFKTSHFSKYIISEKIADKNEQVTIKPDSDNITSDKNEEVTIKPDVGNTNNSTTNNSTANNEESSTETGKGNLPETGAVVSTNVILAIALGTVLVGTAIFFRRKKVA